METMNEIREKSKEICLVCGKKLEYLLIQPKFDADIETYECKNCNTSISKDEYVDNNVWIIQKIKDLETENITLKARLIIIEKELGIK